MAKKFTYLKRCPLRDYKLCIVIIISKKSISVSDMKSDEVLVQISKLEISKYVLLYIRLDFIEYDLNIQVSDIREVFKLNLGNMFIIGSDNETLPMTIGIKLFFQFSNDSSLNLMKAIMKNVFFQWIAYKNYFQWNSILKWIIQMLIDRKNIFNIVNSEIIQFHLINKEFFRIHFRVRNNSLELKSLKFITPFQGQWPQF